MGGGLNSAVLPCRRSSSTTSARPSLPPWACGGRNTVFPTCSQLGEFQRTSAHSSDPKALKTLKKTPRADTVNPLAQPSKVRILLPPFPQAPPGHWAERRRRPESGATAWTGSRRPFRAWLDRVRRRHAGGRETSRVHPSCAAPSGARAAPARSKGAGSSRGIRARSRTTRAALRPARQALAASPGRGRSRQGVNGRSHMNKAQLERAVDTRNR